VVSAKNKSKSIIKVGMVDDHSLFRNAISKSIDGFDTTSQTFSFEILFEAENGLEMTNKIKKLGPPDVIILDINMPIMDGFEAVKWLKAGYPDIKILILTMYNKPEYVAYMMKEGVYGYLTKESTIEDLQSALFSISKGQKLCTPLITESLLMILKRSKVQINLVDKEVSSSSVYLEDRDLELLRLMATELTYKEIADNMGVSPRTIDGYRDRLLEKLHVKSRVGLVLYAINNGLVNIEQ
jgi:DNA-binding NarL/FixJ family response regulator